MRIKYKHKNGEVERLEILTNFDENEFGLIVEAYNLLRKKVRMGDFSDFLCENNIDYDDLEYEDIVEFHE